MGALASQSVPALISLEHLATAWLDTAWRHVAIAMGTYRYTASGITLNSVGTVLPLAKTRWLVTFAPRVWLAFARFSGAFVCHCCATPRARREAMESAQSPFTSPAVAQEANASNVGTSGGTGAGKRDIGGAGADVRAPRKRIAPQLIRPGTQTKKQATNTAAAMEKRQDGIDVSDSLRAGRTILVSGWSGAPNWPAYIERCSVAQDGGVLAPTVAKKSVLLTLFYEAYPEAGYQKPRVEYAIVTGSEMVQWLPGETSEDEEQSVTLSWAPADKEASFTPVELEELMAREIEDFGAEKWEQAAQWVSAQPAHTQLALASGYTEFIASTVVSCVGKARA